MKAYNQIVEKVIRIYSYNMNAYVFECHPLVEITSMMLSQSSRYIFEPLHCGDEKRKRDGGKSLQTNSNNDEEREKKHTEKSFTQSNF